jgi:quercetin dioxygenase-like cupin family protein
MNKFTAPIIASVLPEDVQQTVWFLGALVRIRAGADSTAGNLAILEHHGQRGYGSPLHRHDADEETFLVLDGELRVEVGGQAHVAGAGRRRARNPPVLDSWAW